MAVSDEWREDLIRVRVWLDSSAVEVARVKVRAEMAIADRFEEGSQRERPTGDVALHRIMPERIELVFEDDGDILLQGLAQARFKKALICADCARVVLQVIVPEIGVDDRSASAPGDPNRFQKQLLIVKRSPRAI